MNASLEKAIQEAMAELDRMWSIHLCKWGHKKESHGNNHLPTPIKICYIHHTYATCVLCLWYESTAKEQIQISLINPRHTQDILSLRRYTKWSNYLTPDKWVQGGPPPHLRPLFVATPRSRVGLGGERSPCGAHWIKYIGNLVMRIPAVTRSIHFQFNTLWRWLKSGKSMDDNWGSCKCCYLRGAFLRVEPQISYCGCG